MRKRIISVIVTICLIMPVCICSCGSNNNSDSPATSESINTGVTEESPEDTNKKLNEASTDTVIEDKESEVSVEATDSYVSDEIDNEEKTDNDESEDTEVEEMEEVVQNAIPQKISISINEEKYEWIYQVSPGYFAAEKDGKLQIVDSDGNAFIEECKEQEDSLFYDGYFYADRKSVV